MCFQEVHPVSWTWVNKGNLTDETWDSIQAIGDRKESRLFHLQTLVVAVNKIFASFLLQTYKWQERSWHIV